MEKNNRPKAPSLDEVMAKKKPQKKFRAGPISATIWANESKNEKGEAVSFNTISFDRNYMDKDGNWQTTNSLRTGDIPRAILVLQKAYEYLSLVEDNDSVQDTE